MRARLAVLALLALPAAAASAAPPRDPDAAAARLMTQAEAALTDDPAAAAVLVARARDLLATAHGRESAAVALADWRLALVRALGGDRAGAMAPMAAAADRLDAHARAAATPAERTAAAQALIVTASFAMTLGDPALTERMRAAAAALLARGDLARTDDLAEAWRVAADVAIYQNRPTDALACAERSLALYEALDGVDAPALVTPLARIGGALQRLGRSDAALAPLRRAVAIADRGTGGDPTLPLVALRGLGYLYARADAPDLALPLFQRALVAAEKLPPGFPYAGGIARDIMLMLVDAGRLEEARPYAERTAALTRATLGSGSYEYAAALLALARIETATGRLDAARTALATAEPIIDRGLDPTNTRRAEAVAARARLLAAESRPAQAGAAWERARALLAAEPADDSARIDAAQGSAAAALAAGSPTAAAWGAAREAADALTARIVRTADTQTTLAAETERGRRVFETALDVAWARRAVTR